MFVISIRRWMRVPGAARATMYERPRELAGRSTSCTPMLFAGAAGVAATAPAAGAERAASDAAMIRRPRMISIRRGSGDRVRDVAE